MGNKLNILVVDDNLRDVARIADELEVRGPSSALRRVESVEQFLAGVPSGILPDVILSECCPYGINGFGVIARCRELYPNVPFIFVTHRTDPGLIVEMFENGAAGHVPKGDLHSLGDEIRHALSGDGAEAVTTVEVVPLSGAANTPAPDAIAVTASATSSAFSLVHPLCPSCKRVGDERGLWAPIELHLRTFMRATVELGECPQCRSLGRTG